MSLPVCQDVLDWLVDHRTDDAPPAWVESHTRECSSCQHLGRFEASLAGALEAALPVPGERVWQGIVAKIGLPAVAPVRRGGKLAWTAAGLAAAALVVIACHQAPVGALITATGPGGVMVSSPHPARQVRGATLPFGSKVATGPGGRAVLLVAGASVEMGPDTTAVLSPGQLTLATGRVEVTLAADPRRPPAELAVLVAPWTVRSGAGAFWVRSGPQPTAGVTAGRVLVRGPEGVIELSAGQQLDLVAGAAGTARASSPAPASLAPASPATHEAAARGPESSPETKQVDAVPSVRPSAGNRHDGRRSRTTF